MSRRLRAANWLPLLCGAVTVALVTLDVTADEAKKPEKLVDAAASLIKAENFDEALAIIRAAEGAGSDEVPAALFVLAQGHFRKEQFAESLKLLSEITDRRQESPVASIAWLGKGEVYSRLGDEKQMVECLERGIAAPPVETRLGIMDASDTRNRASEMLANHYLKTAQWDKSLKAFSEWKPSSWCGTCLDQMEAHRSDCILLSLIHLNRHEEAAAMAWRIASKRLWSSDTASFVLIRMYEEAGQLSDLESLVSDLAGGDDSLEAALTPGRQGDEPWRIPAAKANAAKMSLAIKLAQDRRVESRLAPFRAATSQRADIVRQLDARVAAWLLIRDRDTTARGVIAASASAKYHTTPILTLLCLMDTPAARAALVDFAARGDVYELQNACNVVRNNCADPVPILDEVKAKASDDLKRYVSTRRGEPRPLAYRFFEDWPRPTKNSLPKRIPALAEPVPRK